MIDVPYVLAQPVFWKTQTPRAKPVSPFLSGVAQMRTGIPSAVPPRASNAACACRRKIANILGSFRSQADKRWFTGLPSPAAAALVGALLLGVLAMTLLAANRRRR